MKKACVSFFNILVILIIFLLGGGRAVGAEPDINNGPALRFTGTIVLTDATGPVMGILPARAYNQIVWSGEGVDSRGLCQEEQTNSLLSTLGVTLELGEFQLSHFNLVNEGKGDHRIYAGGKGRIKSEGAILLSSDNFSLILDVDYLTSTVTGYGIADLDPNQPSALRDEFDNGSGQVEFVFHSFSPVVQGLFGIFAIETTIRPAPVQHNIFVLPVLQAGSLLLPDAYLSLNVLTFQNGGQLGTLHNILVDRIMDAPGGDPPAGFFGISPYFYWEVGSALASFSADLTFDLAQAPQAQSLENIRVLRRDNPASPWVEYAYQQRLDATHLRAQSVSSAGQWAIGIVSPAKGDINGDGVVALDDAILSLQVLAGAPAATPFPQAEVNGDHQIGFAEGIFVLQLLSGLRTKVINQAPLVPEQVLSLGDGSPAGTIVGRVTASDPNPEDQLTYALSGGNTNTLFALDGTTGELTVYNPKELYFAHAARYDLDVTVSNGVNTATGRVTVHVTEEAAAKNVYTFSTATDGEDLVVTILYTQLLPAGTDPVPLQPRLLEIRPRWKTDELEYASASLGQAALDAEKELALATTQSLVGLPGWSEGRFIVMTTANTNRIAPGEIITLRFRKLSAGFTALGWNHERTTMAPKEANDILKLVNLMN